MLTITKRVASIVFATALVAAFMTALTACKIHVDKSENGKEKKVDIQTPLGGIQVNQDVKVRDTGLPIYPGAREKQKGSDGNGGQANVNISSGFFGLKVVVIEFLSDDPPGESDLVLSRPTEEVRRDPGVPHQEPQRRAERRNESQERWRQQADVRGRQRSDG